MKIIIPGGSGQVGSFLSPALQARGHEVTILSRHPESGACPMVAWDGQTLGDWARVLDGADAVINLAGRSVNCRYTAKNRREIMDSRIDSTRILGAAIARAKRPPRVWLQASTATIYANRYDAPNDEATGVLGGAEPGVPEHWRMSTTVAKRWEQTAIEANNDRCRLVLIRSAMTMAPGRGGVFDTLLGLVRHGLGGRVWHGRQFVSWIHGHDFTAAVQWLLANDHICGPVNLASPNPLPYAQFMRELRTAWGVRFGLPATRWMLEIGTFLLRSESELVLKSRRVAPGRLTADGFEFQFPQWRDAAEDLCRRRREARAGGFKNDVRLLEQF